MMELWLGRAGHNADSSFASDAHRREAWVHNRDRVMELWGCHGRRPLAWWAFEAAEKGLRYPGYEYERSVLWEAGVLTEQERAELEREWRCQWDRCWDEQRDFFHCAGPGKIYNGDEARVRHLVWADVPPVLVYRWLAERERRSESQQAEIVVEARSPHEAA